MAEFLWKGKVLDTIGDVLQAAAACVTREEAQDFMVAYRGITPHADENIVQWARRRREDERHSMSSGQESVEKHGTSAERSSSTACGG